MVGRPRQFDERQALDQVMAAFWANGYEATSMVDLVQATGLHKGSLYQAFGNKHQLFIAALRRYLEDMRSQKNRLLKEARTPREGITAALHGMVEIADADDINPKGCMAVNTLVELAPHDPEVRRVVVEHMGRMRGSMIETIAKAQAAGQIRDHRPAELIAIMLMTFISGLATLMKGPINKPQAHELLDQQLAAMF